MGIRAIVTPGQAGLESASQNEQASVLASGKWMN
jgi:hypothetical protein